MCFVSEKICLFIVLTVSLFHLSFLFPDPLPHCSCAKPREFTGTWKLMVNRFLKIRDRIDYNQPLNHHLPSPATPYRQSLLICSGLPQLTRRYTLGPLPERPKGAEPTRTDGTVSVVSLSTERPEDHPHRPKCTPQWYRWTVKGVETTGDTSYYREFSRKPITLSRHHNCRELTMSESQSRDVENWLQNDREQLETENDRVGGSQSSKNESGRTTETERS